MMIKLLNNGAVHQYMAGITCSITLAIMNSAIDWSAPAIPKIRNNETQLKLTDSEISWMVSSLYIGNLIGPIPAGYLMDLFGRKTTLLYASLFPIVSWVTMLIAKYPYQVYFARLLFGIKIGFIYTIVPNYIAEISEPKIRGSLSSSMQIMSNVAAIYEYSIGPYVSYEILIYASLLIPLVFVLTFIWMPESPYHSVMINKDNKAKKTLTWLHCNKSEEEIEKQLTIIKYSVKEQMKSKPTFKVLISTKGNVKALIIAILISIGQRLTGIGALMAYSSVTIPENSIPNFAKNQCVTLLGIIWFLTSVSSTYIVYRHKRRTLLIISGIGCGSSTLLASIWFFVEEKTTYSDFSDKIRWLPYISFILHAIFYAIGVGPIGASLRGELFPANIKGNASAICSISLAITSFMITKSYLIVANYYGMYLNFLFFGLSCFAIVIFTEFYVIETYGKSLQEIQDELNGLQK
ncbi:facilitated trehalose transporter Tret1-like isoform X2 [Lycorma delicatula]|uniref:facilitated trehalose transporter Tret1-like isoform X2 n=1 Tax=Lycorma delicatula TaxID=130591 RepID=UPI003F5191F5